MGVIGLPLIKSLFPRHYFKIVLIILKYNILVNLAIFSFCNASVWNVLQASNENASPGGPTGRDIQFLRLQFFPSLLEFLIAPLILYYFVLVRCAAYVSCSILAVYCMCLLVRKIVQL